MTITIRKNILMLLHVVLLVLAILALNWQEKATAINHVKQPDLKEELVWHASERKELACCLQKATHVAELMKEGSLSFTNFLAGAQLLRKKQPRLKATALRGITVS